MGIEPLVDLERTSKGELISGLFRDGLAGPAHQAVKARTIPGSRRRLRES
jgi:hypothetical protein